MKDIYYSSKKKYSLWLKLVVILLLLIVVIIAGFWYVSENYYTNKNDDRVIIIKEPLILDNKQQFEPSKQKTQEASIKKLVNDGQLDQVMQNYKGRSESKTSY